MAKQTKKHRAKAAAHTIPVLTAQFVEASEVFFGQRQAWEAFDSGEPDCSWGNNNRTFVTPNIVETALNNARGDDDDTDTEIDIVLERLATLPQDMYIDLEN